MDVNQLIECLQAFGLTRQEAMLYISLGQNGTMTGYEVAKQTGVSRSNAYNALAGLVDKGAAYTEEGTAVKYVAVDVEEFCMSKVEALNRMQNTLVTNMPKRRVDEEGYLTVVGDEHISDRVRRMLLTAERRVYLKMPAIYLRFFEAELKMLVEKKIKIVLITDAKIRLGNTKQYLVENMENEIGVTTDSVHVLTGEYGIGSGSTCVYTGQTNFVRIFKESMKNEIKLIEYTQGDKIK